MEFIRRKIAGAIEIQPDPLKDSRGFFMRTYDRDLFSKNGIDREWVQENHSLSLSAGIIRGFHFQFPPWSEAKLVRCTRGAVLDVFVDLRQDSSTFGLWESVELREDNMKMIFIPRGCAHGFCTLEDNCDVLYKSDNYYSAEHEAGILWSDNMLGIPWPGMNFLLSDKDMLNMTMEQFIKKHKGIKL